MIYSNKLKVLFAKYGIEDTDCGNYIGDGWIPIVDRMFDRMIAAGWDKQLRQIKSKFCELTVYITALANASPAIDKIIKEAEDVAHRSCEDCGQLHGLVTPMIGQALCRVCRKHEK